MVCTHCGANNSDEDQFCQKCGKRLDAMNNDNSTLLASPPIPATPYEGSPYTNYKPPEPIYPPPPPDIPYQNMLNPYESKPFPRSYGKKWYLVAIGVLIVVLLLGVGGFELGKLVKGNPQVNSGNTQNSGHANGNTPTVIATPTLMQTPSTPTPQELYSQVTSGNPVLNDLLGHQDSYNWDESTNCTFVGGTYHASWSQTDNFVSCSPNNQLNNFGDFAFQVQMTIIHGDYGGMFFRANSTGTDYYTFIIYQSGQYSLDVYQNNNDLKSVSNGSSSIFKTGLNQSNLITVIALGHNFYLYMNGQFIARGSDTSNSAGSIGLLAGDNTHPTEVAFSNLKVWSI